MDGRGSGRAERNGTLGIVFEGGNPVSAVARTVTAVRKQVAMDTVEKLCRIPAITEVVVCSNYPDLLEEARQFGVKVEDTLHQGPFHFGAVLTVIVDRYRPGRVLCMSGGSLPLIQVEDLRRAVEQLTARDRVVVVNNAQSADLVAFSPAGVIRKIPLSGSDNFLGYLLREHGLTRELMGNSARVNFDLDTPTDVLILSLQEGVGPRTAAVLRDLEWDRNTLVAARDALARSGAEVFLAGRVGAPVMAYINSHFHCRLRVFSEERGMKALGREERGEVVSLLGRLLDRVGPEEFFAGLAEVCSAGFWDTRVLFAHWRRPVSEEDRFHSDLGRYEEIRDPAVRRFTRAAVAAGLPVVLGGHSLVSGGLWLLAENMARAEGANRPET